MKKDKDSIYIMYEVYSIASFGDMEQYFEYNMKTKKLYYLKDFSSPFSQKGEKLEVK